MFCRLVQFVLGTVLVSGTVLLSATVAQAREGRTPIPGVSTTPLTYCRADTMEFLRHTRDKPLVLEQRRYCTDSDWRVHQVEHDGRHVYWRLPFGPGSEAGKGYVYCRCEMASGSRPEPRPSTVTPYAPEARPPSDARSDKHNNR